MFSWWDSLITGSFHQRVLRRLPFPHFSAGAAEPWFVRQLSLLHQWHAIYAKKWPLDSSLWYSYSWWLKQHFSQLCRLSHRFLYPVPNFSLQDPQLEVEGKMEDEAVGWLEWRVRGNGFCRGQNWWGGEFVLWQAKLFVVGSLVESQGHKAFLAFVAGSWLIQSIQIDEASSNRLSILTFECQTSKVHSTA